MANDFTVMKTSLFGGFKKSDVLALIEQLQNETADIKNILDDKRKEVLELREQLDELTKVNELLAEKENENKILNEKLEAALLENKINNEKIVEYEAKSEKIQRAEKQIGAVYIDARRYSDDLIENARAKAKDIGAIASQDIKRESIEIESLLRDVDIISKKFNTSIEQLHRDVYALSSKLNTSASNLLNLHTDLSELSPAGYEFDAISTSEIDVNIVEDVVVDETENPAFFEMNNTDDNNINSGFVSMSYDDK